MVALDMETTGLDARRHAIVSIGVVPFTLGRIALSERRYWIVRPQRTLHAESVTFHHITHSDIERRPSSERFSMTCWKRSPAAGGGALPAHRATVPR